MTLTKRPWRGSSRAMLRVLLPLACLTLPIASAAAMVGGAPPASDGAGRSVVMLTGSHGTFCSGVALARDLVLTAAHCVPAGADYKLIEFEPRGSRRSRTSPASRGIREFDAERRAAPPRHRRCRAHQARGAAQDRACGARAAAATGRTRRPLRRRGLWPHRARRRQDRRHGARGDARRHRPARHAADPPGRSRDQAASAPGSAPAPAIPARRCSATSAARWR